MRLIGLGIVLIACGVVDIVFADQIERWNDRKLTEWYGLSPTRRRVFWTRQFMRRAGAVLVVLGLATVMTAAILLAA